MQKGPAGGPRPAASCSLNIHIEINKPDDDVEEKVIEGLTRRFQRVDNITITEEVERVQ